MCTLCAYVSNVYYLVLTCCMKVAKFTKLLRKVVLHHDHDDGIVHLPELYYVPYDKVCLI